MKILNLKLRGFVGIKKGMGLDEISLDFSSLSGLIAISGENGRGKSSVIDNLHPYRQLASRAGALQRHVFLRDSHKELSFEFGGDTYRTLVNIDADSERTEGFVWKNGQPQVNGKVTEYDRYINGLFGTDKLFFSSVFCAQNAEKISDMTTGELKKLFSEFLRLDKLIEYENTAKQCAAALSGKVESIQKDIEITRKTMEDPERIAADIVVCEADIDESRRIIRSMTNDLKESEQELEAARRPAAANEAIRQRINDMQANKARISDEIKADEAETEKELFELRNEAQKAIADIKEASRVIESKAAVEEAVKMVAELTRKIGENSTTLAESFLKIDELNAPISRLNEEISAAKAKLAQIISDPVVMILEHKRQALIETMADLDKKDPACTSKTCSFIVRALAAKDELAALEPELESTRANLATERASTQALIDDLNNKLDSLASELSAVREARKAGQVKELKLKGQMAEYQKIAMDQSKIVVAESRIADLQKRRDETVTRGKKIKAALDERTARRNADIERINYEIAKAMDDINVRADNKVSDLQSIIDSHKRHIEDEQTGIVKRMGQLEALKQNLAASQAAAARIADMILEQDRAKTEMAEWLYLKNACSQNGLRALEIDSVAPIISGYANGLLADSFGPEYTVRFRTQNDEGKEVLDILALRDDGSEVLIDNLSGGERVWSLKALRLAMTLISKEKSGKNFTSFFADEEDGALDPENAQNFIGLYRSFMASGGFDTGFFISHKPECVSMADHVLEFHAGGVRVE